MSEWVERPLVRLVSFKKGKKVDTSELPLEGYLPYLGASSLTGGDDGHASPEGGVFCTDSDALMLWDGERSGLVGPGRPGVLSSTVMRLRPQGAMTGRYLVHCLKNRFAWIQARRTGTGVPHVPKDLGRILSLRFPRSEAIQTKICDVLDALDTQIDATEALIAKQERVRAGLMQDLFRRGVDEIGQLRPVHEHAPHLYHKTELGWLPLGWQVKRVHEFCRVKGGKRLPAGEDFADGPTPFPYLRVVDFVDGSVEQTNLCYVTPEIQRLIARYTISKLDLYITIAGTIGLVGGIPRELDSAQLTENAAKLSDINFRTVSIPFIKRVMMSRVVQTQIRSEIGTGGGVPKLALFRIEQLCVPVPPRREQRKIAVRIAHCEEAIRLARASIVRLRSVKSGLMQDLLTGKVSVSPLLEEQVPEGIAA